METATPRKGHVIAYGNTFKRKDELSWAGFRWNREGSYWEHLNWDSSKALPKGITIGFVEPEKPLTLGELLEKLNDRKVVADTTPVYVNDRQYARAMDARRAAQDEVYKLQATIRTLQEKEAQNVL
jgi:hypothetical protein